VVAEHLEEALRGGAVAARGAPHDRAAAVVGDAGQAAVMAAVAISSKPMHNRPWRRASSRWSGDYALNGPPDGLLPDPEHRVIGVNANCWTACATMSSKSRACCAPGSGAQCRDRFTHKSIGNLVSPLPVQRQRPTDDLCVLPGTPGRRIAAWKTVESRHRP
jgi:hypothetical protein